MPKTALIIGITGTLGKAVAHELGRRGWHLKALHRDPDSLNGPTRQPQHVDWIRGDALDERAVRTAAANADIIVHAANPPGYRNWHGLALPMLANTLSAASDHGARILFPGNLYNYGPDAWPRVDETAPQNPTTRKGRIRVEMETMLEAASASGTRSIVIRAGDYFGIPSSSSWLDNAMLKPGKAITSVTYPGAHDVGHSWAYLPDLAQVFADIADREQELPAFERFHFGGHYLERGIRMAETILQVAGANQRKIRRLPWRLVRLAAPFHETYRELLEMRYLWQVAVQPDNQKLVGFLGEEPHTPFPTAVRESLVALGCLSGPAEPLAAVA